MSSGTFNYTRTVCSRERKESTVPILGNISKQIFYIIFGNGPTTFFPMIDYEMKCIPL